MCGSAIVRIAPPRAHVVASGELDLATRPALTAQLDDALASGCRFFELDLRDVSFCDASTIGVVVGVDRRLRASGGSLRIIAASGCVRRIFGVVGLTHLIDPEARERADSLA